MMGQGERLFRVLAVGLLALHAAQNGLGALAVAFWMGAQFPLVVLGYLFRAGLDGAMAWRLARERPGSERWAAGLLGVDLALSILSTVTSDRSLSLQYLLVPVVMVGLWRATRRTSAASAA